MQQKLDVHGDMEKQYVSVGHISNPSFIRFPHSTNFPSRGATPGGFLSEIITAMIGRTWVSLGSAITTRSSSRNTEHITAFDFSWAVFPLY